jgi:hypothetical protein
MVYMNRISDIDDAVLLKIDKQGTQDEMMHGGVLMGGVIQVLVEIPQFRAKIRVEGPGQSHQAIACIPSSFSL